MIGGIAFWLLALMTVMSTHSKLWYLQRFKLFQSLDETKRRLVAEAARMFEVKRGQRVYLSGDPSDQIFLVKTGVVKIASVTPDGREVVLALLHPGDVFGELAVIDDAPRDHFAEVQEDARLCAFDKELISLLTRESPELGYEISKLIGSRVKQFRLRLEELLCKSAGARVAHALVHLADEHGVADAHGTLIPFRLSQRDLANLLGLTRETVNVVLQDFRQRGLIVMERRNIRLADVQKLRTTR